MWYTFPSDKNEQKKCIESLCNYVKEMYDGPDIREDFEELVAIYLGEKPLNASDAYNKLHNIYTEMDLDNNKSTKELFGTDYSLDAFKKNFLEAWKKISYGVLTTGFEPAVAEERDKYLKIYDSLHDNKKMDDTAIGELAKNIDLLLTDPNNLHNNLHNNIIAFEKSLGNKNNADDIYLGLRNKDFSFDQYIKNRLQLLEQFAKSDVADIKAYLPFYGSAKNIANGKKAAAEEVKKVAAGMKDESLNKLRENIKDLWENPKLDPNASNLTELKAKTDATLLRAINSTELLPAKEAANKDDFLDTLKKDCDKAAKFFPIQFFSKNEELKAIIEKNKALVDDINNKMLADPEIAEYEEPMSSMLEGFKKTTETEASKAQFSSLYEESSKKYNNALTRYKESIDKELSVLKNKRSNLIAEDRKYEQKMSELLAKNDKLINQYNQLDVLSKEQLEQHIKDKEEIDLNFKELSNKELPIQIERKASIEKFIDEVQQKTYKKTNNFATIKEDIASSFSTDALAKRYDKIIHNLKSYNEKYTAYFKDVENRYAQVKADRQSLKEVFEAAEDITKKKGFFSIQRKNPKIFTDTMNSVTAYFDDRKNPEKAKAAYDSCRKYISNYMKSDNSGLKSGNAEGNTRRQTVVRMLELMDKLPEFQKFINFKEMDGFEIMDTKDDVSKYTKLNYKQLEASLAKHASKPKKTGNGAKKPERSAFNDIDKLVNKRKEAKNKAKEK